MEEPSCASFRVQEVDPVGFLTIALHHAALQGPIVSLSAVNEILLEPQARQYHLTCNSFNLRPAGKIKFDVFKTTANTGSCIARHTITPCDGGVRSIWDSVLYHM